MYRHGRILQRTRLSPNEFIEYENYYEIVLCNNIGNEVGRTKISKDKIEKVRKCKWGLDKTGYARSASPRIFLHTFITGYTLTDHVSGDRLDNRDENLRPCTSQENQRNKGLNKNNTSGYKGVSWSKGKKMWKSYITVNFKQIHIGYFKSKIDAVKARIEAEKEYFGEFMRRVDLPY